MGNLLFIVPTLKRAGAETQIVSLINNMDSSRYRVHLLVFGDDMTLASSLSDSVTLHHVERQGKLGGNLVSYIADLIDAENIELIHCTLQISLLYGFRGRKRAQGQPKLVCAVHTTINVSLKFEWADRLLYRRLLRSCDAVVYVCKNQRDYWLQRFPDLKPVARVIYNGIDEALFDPACISGEDLRQELQLTEETKVILCVAGFRPEKAHTLLIQAFSRLIQDLPNSMLLLAGDGPERERIEAEIAQKGLRKSIKLLGVTDRIPELLAVADLSVLASVAVETFSMAMLESMAMKTPVVATHIGGASEAIEPDKTGQLVPPGDVDALYKAFHQCLSSHEHLTVMGRICRDRVIEQFTLKQMVDNTQALIDELA